MLKSVVPDEVDLPRALPTGRVTESGKCTPELRHELRRIDDLRNGFTVASLWAMVAGLVALAVWVDNPAFYVLSALVMGLVYVRFAILTHEAAHKLLFSNKRVNDWVGRWLLAYPAFVPIGIYRLGHFAHHKEEFGPKDPDLAYYGGYVCDRATLRRRLVRDAVGISGWKNFLPLLKAVGRPSSRRVAVSILGVQVLLWAASGLATGRWWLYPVLWWLPWMTEWRVLNRLRSISEHGGLIASDDRRITTHVVHQGLVARCVFVPYNTGWHLAHHVDMGVPWRNLPAYHDELVRAGYVVPSLVYPNYRALLRALSSG